MAELIENLLGRSGLGRHAIEKSETACQWRAGVLGIEDVREAEIWRLEAKVGFEVAVELPS